MSHGREKVVVAMSGGVDSSVAAALLVEQGYEVVGFFMRTGVHGSSAAPSSTRSATPTGELPIGNCQSPNREEGARANGHGGRTASSIGNRQSTIDNRAASRRPHQGCCSASDAADARFVAGMLGVPFYALNFEAEFNRLIDFFADEYARGRTPNPCVVCNNDIKFGRIVDYADAVGAKYVATGHYARIGERDVRKTLMRARDGSRDQSYVLFGLDRDVLDRVIFPLGDLLKSEVREIARERGFPNWDKPDSVEICFAPDRDYARIVRERHPEAFAEGEVVDTAGRVVGRHEGIANFTVGQRRGLGIALGKPAYVTNLNVEANTVTLGEADDLLHRELTADRVNFLVDPPVDAFRAEVKIRYLHRTAPAIVEIEGGARTPLSPPLARGEAGGDTSPAGGAASTGKRCGPCVRVTFDEPQRAITPGQAVVFYDGEVVIGGGWIESAIRPDRECGMSNDEC